MNRWAFGMTGHRGGEAVLQLIEHLKDGYATMIAPDGPTGPPRSFRKGVIYAARESGRPIVVVNFQASKPMYIPRQWDDKWLPAPFSTVTAHVHPPLYVTSDNEAEAIEIVKERLG